MGLHNIRAAIELLIFGADPGAAAAGQLNVYAKAGGLYCEDALGNVSLIGPLGEGAPSPLAGNYVTQQTVTAVTSGGVTNGTTTYTPVVVPVARSFDRIAVNVQTASAGGTAPAMRLGIYADDGTFSKPGALVLDCGTVTITATGIQFTATGLPLTLPPGLYWLAAQYTHTVVPTTPPQFNCVNTITSGFVGFGGQRYIAATGQVAGALPTPAPTVTQQTGATGVLVGLRGA